MSVWSSGYNVELGYTFGYYREMAPRWLDFVAIARGITPPSGAWRYLELGCGQGVGLALLAASHPDHQFVGIDFNPLHVAHARGLAAAAGLSNVRFEEANFIDLAQQWPADWGRFDYVAAHGIYSWLAVPTRHGLIGTMGHATAPGALVYVSYNALPGWLSTFPVQHLLRLWQTSEEMQSVKAITSGMERLKALIDNNTAMTRVLPAIADRLKQLLPLDRSYLVQEYLHDDWHPMWFDAVAREMAAAKLTYVGTATVGDLYLSAVLSEEQRKLIGGYESPIVREVMIDVLVNQSFRRDVFGRGNTPLWTGQQRDLLRVRRVVLLNRPAPDSEIKLQLSVGEVSGKKEVFHPLIASLAEGPKSIEELMKVPGQSARTFGDTVEAVAMMLHAGYIAMYDPISDPAPAKSLNRAIARAAASGAPYRNMINSTTGVVIEAVDTDLMMLSISTDRADLDAEQLAETLVDRLMVIGKTLMQNGEPLNDRPKMIALAQTLARVFLEKTWPGWKKTGVV